MKTIQVSIRGIRPILMHNGRLADPLDPWAKKLKDATKKRQKTDDDHAEAARIEWEGGLYWSDELGVYIPTDNLESALIGGAKKTKMGKAAQAGILIEEAAGASADIIFGVAITDSDGKPYRNLEKLRNDERFTMRKGVRVQQARIMRTRPMIPTHWRVNFPLSYDEELLNRDDVERILIDTGRFVGIGDWRPKFGRFLVESIDGKPI